MEGLFGCDQNTELLGHLSGMEKLLAGSVSQHFYTWNQHYVFTRNATSIDFHCTALLFFRHELLSLDNLVLTLCWYSLESWPRTSWNCDVKEHLKTNTSAARLLYYVVILVNTTKNTHAVVHTESINHWQNYSKWLKPVYCWASGSQLSLSVQRSKVPVSEITM